MLRHVDGVADDRTADDPTCAPSARFLIFSKARRRVDSPIPATPIIETWNGLQNGRLVSRRCPVHPPDSRGRHGLVSRRSGWFVGAIVLLAASCATDPSDAGTESTPLPVPALETSTAAPETSADDEPRDKPESTTARPDDSEPAVDFDPAVTTDAQVDPTPLRYDWRQVPIGAGGFVTGIISVPDGAGGAAMYARTDVGGAYRWDESAGHWEQMILPAG